jgi:peptidoglycan/xylan/chitin deacetylase (PgdA/CDA1 family)
VPTFALTYDDGPDAGGTPLVLDALDRASARATFFVIAPQAATHPELIERITAGGHSLGLHCTEHARHSERDEAWCRRDTDDALATLAELGVHPRLWRTPWGDTAPWTAAIAAEHDLRLIHWTVDTHDWRGDTAAEMLAETAPALADGAIVLAHDGLGPGARREDVRETAAFTTLAIDHCRTLELEPVALS